MNKKDKYCYEYPRPAVTADCVVFGKKNDLIHVLLIERAHDPYKGSWALPGGFLDEDETIEACAARELLEETGLKNITLEQLYTFSEPGRDPRGRTVSVAFTAVVNIDEHSPVAGDDAANFQWFRIDSLPILAFDHDKVIKMGIEKVVKRKV